MELLLVILFMLAGQIYPDNFDRNDEQKQLNNNNKNEVSDMTIEEVKDKLLEKIDSMLENASVDDVKKLSEAYTNLNRDILLEKMAERSQDMCSGFGYNKPPQETEAEENVRHG